MTQVKICGITNVEDGLAAAEAGADLLGLVFYAPSPRYVEPDRASEIVNAVRRSSPGVRFAGVFVDESVEMVMAMIQQCSLNLVQLAGNEGPGVVNQFSGRAYKTLRPRDAAQAAALVSDYGDALDGCVPAFIVDAFNPYLYGGTGERADWGIAKRIARQFPILLAGGLSADNVAGAVERVQPWGVDVSSGVERSPGLKDHSKVRRFIDNVKTAKGAIA